jgi:hypothetical protein
VSPDYDILPTPEPFNKPAMHDTATANQQQQQQQLYIPPGYALIAPNVLVPLSALQSSTYIEQLETGLPAGMQAMQVLPVFLITFCNAFPVRTSCLHCSLKAVTFQFLWT